MKIIRLIIVLILLYLTYGVFISHFDLRIIPPEIAARNPEGFHDYAGVINVHSELSTGSGSIPEIIKAAQDGDLDFIYITDLNQFENSLKSYEGYHDNLLVFLGGEYSYANSRILNLGATIQRDLQGVGRAQVVFADMLSQKSRPHDEGICLLAHPLKPRFQWIGEYPPGLDGIEIINLKSLWQEGWSNSKASFIWSLIIYPFNDRLALLRLFRDPVDETHLWDELSKRRHTLGLAGADAEAKIRVSDSMELRYPTYQTLFSLVRNHILLNSELTGDWKNDRDKINLAITQGNFYMSLDILADPRGFSSKITTASGDLIPMGSELKWQEGLELSVHLPHKPSVPFETEIYKDGERLLISNAQDTRIPIHEAGVYRVKVRVIPTLPLPDGKKWIPWIFTNPFYVR